MCDSYRSSMVGSMGDVSIADAIVKKIPGFDVEAAYASLYKDAMELPPKGVIGIGRTCLEAYEVSIPGIYTSIHPFVHSLIN